MYTGALWQAQLATQEDAESISVLANAAFRGDSSRHGWTTEADLLGGQRTDPEKIMDLLLADNSVFLVIPQLNQESDKKLLACVHLEKKDESRAYLGMLTVDPFEQAGGVGRYLLKTSEDFVKKEWQCKVMEMTVISLRHELVNWYLRRGYKLTGEKRPFPMNDPRFGIPKCPLEFVVLEKQL